MRKFSFVLTMLALVLVFGLAFVSCGDDNGNNNTPGGQTPGGQTPGGGAQGYLTLTDIPAAYNGKYIYFVGAGAIGSLVGNVYGCQNVTSSAPYTNLGATRTITCIQIADGRVVLPLWLCGRVFPPVDDSMVETVTKFSGGVLANDHGIFYIHDSPTHIASSDYSVVNESPAIAWFIFFSIKLTNDSATVSANDGDLYAPNR